MRKDTDPKEALSMNPDDDNIAWEQIFTHERKKPYFVKLSNHLKSLWDSGISVYPERKNILKAFELCPFNKVKVVILGQDPYHTPGKAMGLAFSVDRNCSDLPASLKNIFKEAISDVNIDKPTHGDLSCWARQGVLLLNTCLTVLSGQPGSHQGMGWERFVGRILYELVTRKPWTIYLLWGAQAQKTFNEQRAFINKKLILRAAHPSPYSVSGFYGCRHFSKVNKRLVRLEEEPINWEVI